MRIMILEKNSGQILIIEEHNWVRSLGYRLGARTNNKNYPDVTYVSSLQIFSESEG